MIGETVLLGAFTDHEQLLRSIVLQLALRANRSVPLIVRPATHIDRCVLTRTTLSTVLLLLVLHRFKFKLRVHHYRK